MNKNSKVQLNKYYFIITILLLMSPKVMSQTITLYSNSSIKQVNVAIREIESSIPESFIIFKKSLVELENVGEDTSIIFCKEENNNVIDLMKKEGVVVSNKIEPEGFCIRVSGKLENQTIWIIAKDNAGLLYGGFDVAEQIRLYGLSDIKNKDENPYMKMRGMKFNISLDYRNPTYSDPGDAATMNIEAMWDLDFWKEFLDEMAKHRYNFISFWNLHPFPSLVKVPDYPNIALDDVMSSTSPNIKKIWLRDRDFSKMKKVDVLQDCKIILKMSIVEKIALWQAIMEYAMERNIEIYFITWNIFVNGTYGQYGITDEINNQITIDYFRKSVKQMFLTYPLLAGIGLTTGENIPGSSTEEKENWAFNTYGRGVLDAIKEQPHRKIKFIHRQHEAKVEDVFEKFDPILNNPNIDFIFSYKYAKAHSYSALNQPFKDDYVKVIQKKEKVKTIWTLRNDSNYLLRWGGSNFLRQFIKNIPIEVSEGYYVGSDGYIWGKDFVSRYPNTNNQLDIMKHWYSWMLWGRLGYNPNITDEYLIARLNYKYPGVDATSLFNAWQNASQVYPLTTGFHWASLDFMWYIEACQSDDVTADTYSGFRTVEKFISQRTHPGTDNISIPLYVNNKLVGKEQVGTTPFMVAEKLKTYSNKALATLETMKCKGNFEIWQLFEDIRAIAYLGKYYACKITAATEIALFRETNELQNRDNAIEQLKMGVHYWRNYVSTLTSLNKSRIYFKRIGLVDWHKSFFDVLHELVSFGGEQEIKMNNPSEGGQILEAEDGFGPIMVKENSIRGFTGSGYVKMNLYSYGDTYVEWNYDASEDGIYLFEIRYTNWENPRISEGRILINDEFASNLTTWGTGSIESWSTDKIYLNLKKGKNNIKLYPQARIYLDHLNVVALNDL